jgi:UDP-glucose 4-epimerase
MKIIITGGTGFVGTNLIPKLIQEGHEIILIDNLSQSSYNKLFHENAKFYLADIKNRDIIFKIFKEEKPHCTFHFAGLVSIYDCHKNTVDTIENNILGSVNVFDAVLQYGNGRVIFSESSAVYENCILSKNGFNELQSSPNTLYATSKAAISLIAQSYANTRNLKYTALRYFNIAGPIQDYKRTIPPLFAGVALRLLGNNNPIIFGDGTRRRDFIHVDDINDFHIQCLTDNRTINQTFNLGLGKCLSLFEICEIIHKYLNIKFPLKYDFHDEINGEAHTIFADISKAKSIGFNPKKTINDAIYDTIDYLLNEIEIGNINPKIFMTKLNTKNIKI